MSEKTIADTQLLDSTARALGILPTPPAESLPPAPQPKRSRVPTWFLLALCLIGALVGCSMIGIAYLMQPDRVSAAPIVFSPTATQRPIVSTLAPTMTPTPQPTATATPAMVDVPAQPKWMTANCLYQIESIVAGEATIVGGDALRFVAEQVLRDAYRLKCVGLAKRWYATSDVSDSVRAAVISALRDWPAVEWPICDWVIGAVDVRRVMATDKAATVDVVFSSADHRWAVIGLVCREAGK